MKYATLLALQASFFGFLPNAYSQALEETTALLNNPAARSDLIQSDPKAKEADQQVKNLGLGAAGEAKLYEISGKILETMAAQFGGDSEKMGEHVEALIRNPASLENQLTPEQKADVHQLATHVKP